MRSKLLLATLVVCCFCYFTRAQDADIRLPVKSEKNVVRDSMLVKVVKGINASIKSRYKHNLKGHIESGVIDGVKGMVPIEDTTLMTLNR